MNTPSNLLYTKEHEWIRVEGDVAYVGITDYAQSELGEIVFVDRQRRQDLYDQRLEQHPSCTPGSRLERSRNVRLYGQGLVQVEQYRNGRWYKFHLLRVLIQEGKAGTGDAALLRVDRW